MAVGQFILFYLCDRLGLCDMRTALQQILEGK